MKQKSQTRQTGAAKVIKDIRRLTRKQYSAEEKIRMCWTACAVKKPSPGFAAGKASPRTLSSMDASCSGVVYAIMEVAELHQQEATMTDITTIGLDLAKTVFQVHGADKDGKAVLRKKLRRGQVHGFFGSLSPCWHGGVCQCWAPELQALGHEVRLIASQYVKPFVKTNKNDVSDAEAICEALLRPTMRFAPVKSAEQQSDLMLHRAWELLVRQKTMLINALRGHCGEFGLVVAQGAFRISELITVIEDPEDNRLPELARKALGSLVTQLKAVQAQITVLEKRLMAWHRASDASRRLETIPGVGVITATVLVATIGDASQFHSARQLSAWLGLVPRQYSSGGKDRLGRISKRGDGYLRKLLVHGARTVLLWSRRKKDNRSAWLEALLARRPVNVVSVATANKTARVVWATLSRRKTFRVVT